MQLGDNIDFRCNFIGDWGKVLPSCSQNIVNEYVPTPFKFTDDVRTIIIFKFDDGTEIIEFPIFEQQDLLEQGNPQFTLVGVPRMYPLLYEHIDDNLVGSTSSGSNSFTTLFDVDISLIYGTDTVRGFNYTQCRSIDYVVKTQHDKNGRFFKGFALTNEFHFECQGYHPNNPVYDSMFKVEKANTTNSSDLKTTDSWPIGFS